MLKISARATLRTACAQSFKIAVLLSCYASIVIKIIPDHFAAPFKLPVKFENAAIIR